MKIQIPSAFKPKREISLICVQLPPDQSLCLGTLSFFQQPSREVSSNVVSNILIAIFISITNNIFNRVYDRRHMKEVRKNQDKTKQQKNIFECLYKIICMGFHNDVWQNHGSSIHRPRYEYRALDVYNSPRKGKCIDDFMVHTLGSIFSFIPN